MIIERFPNLKLKLKVFLKLWENHPAVVETAFYTSWKMMWGKHIFEKTWGLYWKSSFEQKRIGRLVKTAFHVCGEILYELCVLQTIFPRNFFADLSPKFFVNVFKTAFNVSLKNLRAMKFLWKVFKLYKNVWILSEIWESNGRKFFGRFDKNCVSPLSRTFLKRISERRIQKFFSKIRVNKVQIHCGKILALLEPTFYNFWKNKREEIWFLKY